MTKKSLALSTSLLIAGSIALALSAPLAASAHVTIDDDTAQAGTFTLITFKVPNESATTSTSRITVTLPSDTPFAYVSYVPVPGWTTELVTTTLPAPVKIGDSTITEAVTSVIWTASDGNGVTDGQLQLFPLSVGIVPDVGSLTLPVEQDYSDGTVVSWSEKGSEDEVEHPAPVLYVNDTPVADDDHESPVTPATPAASTASPDVLARVLGTAGLVLGAGGIAFGAASRRRAKAGS